MASRKDFASKKRSSKPTTRKASSAKAAQSKSVPKDTSSALEASVSKKPWKLIIASLIAIGVIGLLLQQLINIDPREIRESGIAALIEQQADNEPAIISQPVAAKSNTVTTAPKAAITTAPTAQISSDKKTNTDATNQVPIADKSTQAIQKEPYQFYKILAENSVETETIEAYKSTPKTAKLQNKTLLQTGSFRLQKDAERMKARLIINNFPSVKVTKTSSDRGTWYRVRTGPFITFNTLKSALIKLNKLNITPMQVPLG